MAIESGTVQGAGATLVCEIAVESTAANQSGDCIYMPVPCCPVKRCPAILQKKSNVLIKLGVMVCVCV